MTLPPAEMVEVIQDAAIALGLGAKREPVLVNISLLMYRIAVAHQRDARSVPLDVLRAAFDMAVEYSALAMEAQVNE